jgi:hypothetical protein
VPTNCSWLNLIMRWFAELTNQRIRRGSFLSVADLVTAIEDFLAAWNENPRPFSGPPQLTQSSPNPLDAARLWNGYSLDAPPRKHRNKCPANSWTLH